VQFDSDEMCPYFNNFIDAEGTSFAAVRLPEALFPEALELQEAVLALKVEAGTNPLLPFHDMRFRVTLAQDSSTGSWYSCRRILHPLPRLNDFTGLQVRVKQSLLDLGIHGKSGLVLVVGPSGSGKTTLLSSLMREYVIVYGGTAITCEDPPEFPLSGWHSPTGRISQWDIYKYRGGLAEAMRECLRSGPNYIMPGEARSPSEAAEVLRAAVNGHLVITTAHASDPATAVDRLISLASGAMGEENARMSLASGIAAILHQQMKVDARTRTRSYEIEALFFSKENAGIRSMIRNGKTEQLRTEIFAQGQRASLGLDPLRPERGQSVGRR
jgi:twitching motility protein PilT